MAPPLPSMVVTVDLGVMAPLYPIIYIVLNTVICSFLNVESRHHNCFCFFFCEKVDIVICPFPNVGIVLNLGIIIAPLLHLVITILSVMMSWQMLLYCIYYMSVSS